jgi:hypothetical protein
MVVVFAVFRAQDLRLQFAGKEFHIEELVSQPGVEAFRVCVLSRGSGFDVERAESFAPYPCLDLPGNEFRTVVAAQEFRSSSLGEIGSQRSEIGVDT